MNAIASYCQGCQQQIITISLKGTIEWADFHFNWTEIIPYGIYIYEVSMIVWEVGIEAPACMIPPSSSTFICTILSTMIVIIICTGTKLPAIVIIYKWVSNSDPSKSNNSQWVFINRISYFKLSGPFFSTSVLHVINTWRLSG